MAKRNDAILDDLALLPWWVNVILALISYLGLKYWIPAVKFQNPFYQGMASGAPHFAPIIAGILLVPAVLSAFNAWRKGQLLEKQKDIGSIRSVSWREFEELIAEAYRRKGYGVAETGGGGADGGVDLVLRKNGEHLLVQCKNWRMEKVGVKIVRELYGVVAAKGATGGIVICSGTFTREARSFVTGKPLELIDGTQLARMVEEVKKTPATDKVITRPVTIQPSAAICPICGREMVLRTAQKGPRAGEKFWGCSAFPKCRGTKTYAG